MWYFATTALNVCWTPRRAWNLLLKQTQAYALRWRKAHFCLGRRKHCGRVRRLLYNSYTDEYVECYFNVVHTYRAGKSEGRRNKTQTDKMTQEESGDISQIKTNNHKKNQKLFHVHEFLKCITRKTLHV